MADNSSTMPDALQDFLRHCAQSTLQLDSIKHNTQKIVKQALSDILEPIKPGRFLLENRSITRKNTVKLVEQDEEEQKSEDEQEEDFDSALHSQVQQELEAEEEIEGVRDIDHDKGDGAASHDSCELLDEEEEEEDEEKEQGDEEYEEDDDDDHSDHDGYGEAYVEVNHRLISIWQYLGKEWSEQIHALQNVPPLGQPPWLLTELRPWQLTGSAKLRYLASTRHYGGIFGDEQGLGKSLTVLTTMMEEIQENGSHPPRGFNLIVTTKTCIPQWVDEVKDHFGPAAAARTFVLENVATTANELLDGRYDFVLCTYQFIENRYRAYEANEMFYELVEKIGLEETLGKIPNHEQPDLKRRHINALFSPVYRELSLPIRHLILDEAQYVKNPIARTHKAIKALYYTRVFLLSGTFLPNKWYDIFGLIDFLPGHPFKTRKQFMKAFGRKDASGAYLEPSRSKQNRLVKFLQAIVVSRPAALLKLKGMKKQHYHFKLNEDDQAAVVFHTKKLVDSLKKRANSDIYLGDLSTNDAKTRAMFHAIRAQQHCANPCLIRGRVEAAEDKIRSQGRRLLEQLLAQCAIQETQSQMEALWNIITPAPPQHQDIPNESDVDDQLPEDLEEDPEWLPGVANQADEDDDDDKEEEEEEEDETKYETEHALSHPTEDRNAWLARVRTLTDEELYTPKVSANLRLLHHIHETWPDEKVVIFSRMLKYLDVLDEAIKRDPACVREKMTALRFDGTLDAAERMRVRQSFSNPKSNAPILITAGSGGAGMNLTAGSKIIQCEPWWNGNDEDQCYSRCWRMGQTKEVDVWILRGQNSLIDYVLERARDKKTATNVEIIRPLRRMDDQPPAIPRQFRYGVGE